MARLSIRSGISKCLTAYRFLKAQGNFSAFYGDPAEYFNWDLEIPKNTAHTFIKTQGNASSFLGGFAKRSEWEDEVFKSKNRLMEASVLSILCGLAKYSCGDSWC